MGLTIHYTLRSRARSPGRIHEQLEALHRYASTLDFEYLSPVESYEGLEADYDKVPRNEDEKRWFLIQSQASVPDPADDRCWYPISASHVIGFSTWPAEGSEMANFGLARYPSQITDRGRRIKTNLTGWRWGSFCKTQYASRHGPKNFLKAHLGVIAMLDEAERLGILHDVSDEGGYWENRDVENLVKTVCDWNESMAAFAGQLDDLLPKGMKGHSPIKAYGDYEQLEAKGRAKKKGFQADLDGLS